MRKGHKTGEGLGWTRSMAVNGEEWTLQVLTNGNLCVVDCEDGERKVKSSLKWL